jgi:hypothetical protein
VQSVTLDSNIFISAFVFRGSRCLRRGREGVIEKA